VKRLAGATWLITVVFATACGLDRGGLLSDADPGSGFPEAGGSGDGGTGDATTGDEGGPSLDATVEGGAARDGGADGTRDAPVEARLGADGAVDGSVLDASDAGADGPGDAPAPSDSAAEAAPDAAPLPLRWDGGAVADPVFVLREWEDFCAALVACGELPSMSACMALQAQPSSPDALIPPPSLVNAVNAAVPDCGGVARALGDGSACSSSVADRCAGGSLVTCRWGFQMTIDCGANGMVCSDGSTGGGGAGGATCGFGDCAPSQEGLTYCADLWMVRCTNGRLVPALDCGTYGVPCVGPAGSGVCQGGNRPACLPTPDTCSGSSVVSCLGGRVAGLDCSNVYDPSFTCVAPASGPVFCAAGTACDATHVDTCTGSKGDRVDYCAGGAEGVYACRNAGYSGCHLGVCTP